MDAKNLVEKVRELIAKQLCSSREIVFDRPFDQLGLDSFDQLELLMTIEDQLGCTIKAEFAAEVRTPAELIEILQRQCFDD